MRIKTISASIEYCGEFDKLVNEALSDGWILSKRYLKPGCNLADGAFSCDLLIAELYKDETVVEPDVERILIKYFEPDLEPIGKIAVGDWIDLRAAEDVTLLPNEYRLIRLGVGMILPEGYEAHVLPRSSTPAKFGIIMANSMGVIDNSYSGDEDEWKFPALAFRETKIRKGDRIAQFRIVKNQPGIKFETVPHLRETSRGGIGSTGTA